ncbi:uncharacterized protein VTP21DRAFT_11243 [Calcarisporiella thermophila]|uniref:uncharacterized protein n=1 Tax=Calcarisporiella thermophila TaxID=911321 RepID=UPI003743C1EB
MIATTTTTIIMITMIIGSIMTIIIMTITTITGVVSSENRNANTKASGPGDNSNLSKQGGEGIYFKGGHYHCDDC